MQCPGEATDKRNNKTKPPGFPLWGKKQGTWGGASPQSWVIHKGQFGGDSSKETWREKISLFITFLIRWIILFYIVLMQLTDVF